MDGSREMTTEQISDFFGCLQNRKRLTLYLDGGCVVLHGLTVSRTEGMVPHKVEISGGPVLCKEPEGWICYGSKGKRSKLAGVAA